MLEEGTDRERISAFARSFPSLEKQMAGREWEGNGRSCHGNGGTPLHRRAWHLLFGYWLEILAGSAR